MALSVWGIGAAWVSLLQRRMRHGQGGAGRRSASLCSALVPTLPCCWLERLKAVGAQSSQPGHLPAKLHPQLFAAPLTMRIPAWMIWAWAAWARMLLELQLWKAGASLVARQLHGAAST